MSTDTSYTEIDALDEASQQVDDILDGVYANSDIPEGAVKDFLEDIIYRCEIAARRLND